MKNKKQIASLEKNRPPAPIQDTIDKWDRYVMEFKDAIDENLTPSQASWIIEWCEHERWFFAEAESTRFRSRALAAAEALGVDGDEVPVAKFSFSCVIKEDESVEEAVKKIDAIRLKAEVMSDEMVSLFVRNIKV